MASWKPFGLSLSIACDQQKYPGAVATTKNTVSRKAKEHAIESNNLITHLAANASATVRNQNHHVGIVHKYPHSVKSIVHCHGRTFGDDVRVETGSLLEYESLTIFRLHPDAFGPRTLASFDLHGLDDANEDGTCHQAGEDDGNGPLVHDDDFVIWWD